MLFRYTGSFKPRIGVKSDCQNQLFCRWAVFNRAFSVETSSRETGLGFCLRALSSSRRSKSGPSTPLILIGGPPPNTFTPSRSVSVEDTLSGCSVRDWREAQWFPGGRCRGEGSSRRAARVVRFRTFGRAHCEVEVCSVWQETLLRVVADRGLALFGRFGRYSL